MDNYSNFLIESAFNSISYYQEANEMFDSSEQVEEGYKPFPDEKVERQQIKMRANPKYLENRMRMGSARRRAAEAEREGTSQQEAGKGWYHQHPKAGKKMNEQYFIEMLAILEEAGYLESEEDFLSLAEAAIELHEGGLLGKLFGKKKELDRADRPSDKPKKVTAYDLAYNPVRAKNQLEVNKGSKKRYRSIDFKREAL